MIRPIVERVGDEVKINLFPKQAEFVNSEVDDILVGGAASGGKSMSLLVFAAIRRMAHPNSNGLMLRRTFSQLEKSLILKSKEIYPLFGATYHESKKLWSFPNGSLQHFGYLERDADVLNYHSDEYHDICFDEASLFTPFQINYMTSRCRSTLLGCKPLIRLASNPGNVGHCVPFGEVLTPGGWVDIKDFKIGDKVFTVSKEGFLIETVVNQVHQSFYDGEMIHVKQGGLQIICTPKHSVAKIFGKRNGKWTRSGESEKWSLCKFDELPGQTSIFRSVDWQGSNSSEFIVPPYKDYRKTKLMQPDKLPIDIYAQFMGWFLSEGHTCDSNKTFGITQLKKDYRNSIRELLNAAGFKYGETQNGFIIYSGKWHSYLRQFGKCRDKFIPGILKNADKNILLSFFTCMVNGDGHWVKKGMSGQYYTISKKLADDFMEVAVKLGFLVHMKMDQQKDRIGLRYSVYFQKTKTGGTEILTGNHVYKVSTFMKRRSNINRLRYSGSVYCIGIEGTHSFVIRQNGSAWVSGNSFLKKRYIDPGKINRIWTDPITKKTLSFISAKIDDNPAMLELDPGYKDRLKVLGDQKYMALAEGNWDVFEGAYFDFDIRPGFGVLPYRRVPDTDTFKFLSLDWGYAEPASIHWHELMPSGRLITYRELYITRLSPKELAAKIIEMSPSSERYEYICCSPEIWGKKIELDGGGESIQSLMQSVLSDRIPMIKASNARIPGWLKMKEYMSKAGDGRPWWQISPVCEHLIENIIGAIYDDRPGGNIEDISPMCEDHAIEDCRYGISSLQNAPQNRGEIISPYERLFGIQTESKNYANLPMTSKGGY